MLCRRAIFRRIAVAASRQHDAGSLQMFTAIAFLIVGLVLLVYSADFLVKGASNLAAAVGVSIFLYVLSMDGLISRVDGIVLFGNEKTLPRHFRSGD
jgi:Ca2+/Na+ antiporter